MQARTIGNDFYRLGALSALIGGVLAIVFNLLHPRSSAGLGNARAELNMIANSNIWKLDHIMLGLALALLFVGIIAISMSMWSSSGETWARAWLIFSAVASAVLLVLLAIDGAAIKSLADQWVGAGKDAMSFAAANTLLEINGSLLGASVALSFGISPLLFGMAVLASERYPRAIGQASIASGVLGLVAALWFAFNGFGSVPLNVLFPLASLLYAAALMWAAWELLNGTETPTVRRERKTVTRTETPITPGL